MIDNYNDFKRFIESLDYKPKLLLHACCAPCSSHVLLLLLKYFDVTIFYSNDNITPKEEYLKRLDQVIKFADIFNVKVLYDEYKKEDYYNAVKGLEHLGERSKRCYECYKLRMEKSIIKAKELGFDFYTTTLSISPYKVTKWINEIGYILEDKYKVKYLYSDFKKDAGYVHSIELSNEYCLYRQNYCGCEFSKKEKEEHDRIKKENQSKEA